MKNFWIKYEKLLSGLLLLVVIVLYLYQIQFSTPNLVGNDGYYHIKMAEIMRLEGLKPAFPWLPLTILNPAEFSDHHFLFHVLMIPFTFGDLIIGAKWASIVFAAAAFISIWWLFRGQHIPFAGLWTLGLLAVSEAFIYRMSMPRTQSLSLAFLVLGLHLLLKRKYIYLFPLSFFFVWLYDAFPLMIILSIVYMISVWMMEGKLKIQPLLFVLAGVTFGLLINPYFPDNIIFGARHLIPKLLGEADVRVGNEWYPYETTQLLSNSLLGLLAFLSGVMALGLNNKRMDTRTATALFLAIFFGLMLFQSRRFIEYFPPFALIFSAMAWAPVLNNPWQKFREQVIRSENGRFFWVGSFKEIEKRSWLPGIALIAILIFGIWSTAQAAQENLADSKPAGLYSQASNWLIGNTPQRTRIFQSDWDDFPKLFFHNTWNTYLIGLDPTYLEIKDPALFDTWIDITQGEVELPSQQIIDEFAAQYILTDLAHKKFINRVGEDPAIVEVYRDEEAIIYWIDISAR